MLRVSITGDQDQGTGSVPGHRYRTGVPLAKGLQDVRPRKVREAEIEADGAAAHPGDRECCHELTLIGEETQERLGSAAPRYLEVHKLILDDPEIRGEALRRIREEQLNAGTGSFCR